MNAPERSSLPEGFHTHEVTNPPSGLSPYDAWATDTPLREAIIREGGGWAEADIARYGRRIDEVEFHPAYHRIMALGIERGVPSYGWRWRCRPASCCVRAGNRQVADTFCESRLGQAHGQAFGTLPAHTPMDALIERGFPAG